MARISHTQPTTTPEISRATRPMTTADYMEKARILRAETVFLPILASLQSGLTRFAGAFFAQPIAQDKKPSDLDMVMQARAYQYLLEKERHAQ